MNIPNLNLFDSSRRLKRAFRAVKVDMDIQKENHDALKRSAHDWITFLNRENQDLKLRVKLLERKLDITENGQDDSRLSVLNQI
ncbi:hypothetical protein ACFL3V_04810 [Nanoarchaeota archaeon]